jgi:hypothetical protein
MASVKKLKKQLKTLAIDLLDELSIYSRFHPDTDEQKIKKIKTDILSMWNTYLQEINSIKKQKKSREQRKQFAKIISEIKEKMVPLLDQLSK